MPNLIAIIIATLSWINEHLYARFHVLEPRLYSGDEAQGGRRYFIKMPVVLSLSLHVLISLVNGTPSLMIKNSDDLHSRQTPSVLLDISDIVHMESLATYVVHHYCLCSNEVYWDVQICLKNIAASINCKLTPMYLIHELRIYMRMHQFVGCFFPI